MVIGNEPKSTQTITCGTAHGQMTFVYNNKLLNILCSVSIETTREEYKRIFSFFSRARNYTFIFGTDFFFL